MKYKYILRRSQVTRLRGFTLIEVMIVVAIVGIISAIAFPSYQTYVLKSRRASAQGFLQQIVLKEEEYFSSNRAYTTNYGTGGLGLTAPTETTPIGTIGYYTYAICTAVACNASTPSNGYIITATRTGIQVRDAVGEVKINSAGEKCTTLAADDKWGNNTKWGSGTNC